MQLSQLRPARLVAARSRSVGVKVRALLPLDAAEKLKDYKKVLVAGATGKTGREIVEQLQTLGIPVRALVRDVAKADQVLRASPYLEVVRGDVFQYSSLPRAVDDADALIIATGAGNVLDPVGPFNIDYQGTANLVSLAVKNKIKKVVLVTSIGTDELLSPLNLFWGVLFWKKRAEEVLQRSGLDYTIVRPGGLKNELGSNEVMGNIVMEGPGYFASFQGGLPYAGYLGLPPPSSVQAGSILRRQVAEVCVAALYEKGASNKVVEVVAQSSAPYKPYDELFESVY